jgi:ATP-dependent Clp protease ATP-binding subunit ClpA
MLDACFNRAGKSLLNVIRTASLDANRQKSPQVGTEHLLLAIAREPNDLANKALASMKIDAGSTQLEVDQYHREKEPSEEEPSLGARYAKALMHRLCSKDDKCEGQIVLTDSSVEALLKAEDYSRFFGQDEIEPAHLLLGILDLREAGAIKIFEEMSANLIFLRRQVIHLLAQRMATCPKVVNLKTAVINGLKELVDKHECSLDLVSTLSQKSQTQVRKMPGREEVLHMVCIGYLADFLYAQVAFQRYLLEETLDLLANRTGSLDKEISAGIVAGSAQNLREDVRATIEYLWSHEYRMIDQMLNEAEYDVIGSMIEDLWWAQSEEIVLDQTFAAALEDHRRSQILSLQERRIEVTQRISKLKSRLDETVRQTFEKRTIKA